MNESGARDLQVIERTLAADDPVFTSWFRSACEGLGASRATGPGGPVVVAVDGTLGSLRAVEWAAERASTSGADLRIVHAIRWRSYPLDYGMGEVDVLSDQQAGLEICRSALDLVMTVAPDVRVTAALVSGSVGPALVQAARDAVLLVVAGFRLGGLGTLLLGSALPCIIDRATCDVAILPASPSALTGGTASTSPVSVGVDGGPGDVPALARALQAAESRQAAVLVACAAGAERATATELSRLRRHILVPRVDCETVLEPVAEALARVSSRSSAVVCDRSLLAIVGPRRGRAGRRLLNQAHCPVLLTGAAPRRPGGPRW
jgi:nucleotide-binding universal stress UspA family protein